VALIVKKKMDSILYYIYLFFNLKFLTSKIIVGFDSQRHRVALIYKANKFLLREGNINGTF